VGRACQGGAGWGASDLQHSKYLIYTDPRRAKNIYFKAYRSHPTGWKMMLLRGEDYQKGMVNKVRFKATKAVKSVRLQGVFLPLN